MCLCMYPISFIMFLSFLVLSCERHPHAMWIGCAVKAHQNPRTKTFVRSSPPSPVNEHMTAIEDCDQRAEMCQLLNDQVSSVYRLLVTFVAVFSAQGDLSIGSTGPIEKCGFVRYHALSHSGHSQSSVLTSVPLWAQKSFNSQKLVLSVYFSARKRRDKSLA